ncbi:uncharacterized protein LOC142338276 [Convolutriloba macropyga]|uniref:uncharacterized protein LOC142338276 n=1 Tax=Convolutriloba macropyga TaxID=536237 RepID=UPI003F51D4B6
MDAAKNIESVYFYQKYMAPWLTAWTNTTSCSCFCGHGVWASQRDCVWSELNVHSGFFDIRTQRKTGIPACGPAKLDLTRAACFLRECVVQKLVSYTWTGADSGTTDLVYFNAHRNNGQVCEIGAPTKGGSTRLPGWRDVFHMYAPCPGVCFPTSETVFDYMTVRLDGTDPWQLRNIWLTVNGVHTIYHKLKWITNENVTMNSGFN